MPWLNPFYSEILISRGIETSVETLTQFKAPQIAKLSNNNCKRKVVIYYTIGRYIETLQKEARVKWFNESEKKLN